MFLHLRFLAELREASEWMSQSKKQDPPWDRLLSAGWEDPAAIHVADGSTPGTWVPAAAF